MKKSLNTVFVCHGKACRKKAGAQRKLLEVLDEAGCTVIPVSCQKICKGPVAGIRTRRELLWFRSLRSQKSLEALLALLRGGSLAKSLKRRIQDKRTNKMRS